MLAFIFAGLTSRRGLLSEPPCEEVVESFSKNIFSKIKQDFHVYIVGDTDCYARACDYFGRGRVIQCLNVPTTDNLNNYASINKPGTAWQEYINNVGFTNSTLKMSKVKLIQDYSCVIQIRHDLILYESFEPYITKFIENEHVHFASLYSNWIFMGKQDIMEYLINTYNRPINQIKIDDIPFKTTGILDKKDLIEWTARRDLSSNTHEILFSNIIVQYFIEKEINIDGKVFHICVDFGRPYDTSHHEPHFLVLKNSSKNYSEYDLLNN